MSYSDDNRRTPFVQLSQPGLVCAILLGAMVTITVDAIARGWLVWATISAALAVLNAAGIIVDAALAASEAD